MQYEYWNPTIIAKQAIKTKLLSIFYTQMHTIDTLCLIKSCSYQEFTLIFFYVNI